MPKKEQDKSVPMLEDVLIALQKSFSRLSEQTAVSDKKVPGRPLALMTGDVEFDISMSMQPVATDNDWDSLAYSPSGGGIALRLSGKISTDLRVNPDAGADPNGKKPQK